MTDFYTLLKKSILERRIHDPGQRQAVYAQARSALIRQLAGQKLSNEQITKRVIDFDRAMRRIESELAAEIARGADVSEAAVDDGPYDDPEIEREASGWDVRDEAVDEDDPRADVEADEPRRGSRRGAEYDRPSLGTLARRTPRTAPDDDDDMLPPAPYRDQWNDEEAVLREEDEGGPGPAPAVRRLPPPQRRLGWTLSDKDKVRVLVGAIGALALILLGLVVYLFLPGRDSGVTLPITVGAVNDAGSANRIASQSLDVKQSFVLFDGRDPTVFQSSSDNPVRLDSDSGGAFARIGTSTSSTGIKVQIGPGLASRLAGQNVRVVVTARASQDRGALNMRFAYQSGVALSHWQTANLAPAYADAGMTWIVPQLRTSSNGTDYLLIEPGIPGDGTYADIRNIRIDLLGSAPPSA